MHFATDWAQVTCCTTLSLSGSEENCVDLTDNHRHRQMAPQTLTIPLSVLKLEIHSLNQKGDNVYVWMLLIYVAYKTLKTTRNCDTLLLHRKDDFGEIQGH